MHMYTDMRFLRAYAGLGGLIRFLRASMQASDGPFVRGLCSRLNPFPHHFHVLDLLFQVSKVRVSDLEQPTMHIHAYLHICIYIYIMQIHMYIYANIYIYKQQVGFVPSWHQARLFSDPWEKVYTFWGSR